MGYRKLGLAFCTGLSQEAATVTEILEKAGFEVVSTRCKVGAVPKEIIGIQATKKSAVRKAVKRCAIRSPRPNCERRKGRPGGDAGSVPGP